MKTKDGANKRGNVASKRLGSTILESRPNKRRRKEIGEKADDASIMSPITDMEQLSETTPADTPITVTGLQSFRFHEILGQGSFGKVMLATHPSCQQQLAVKMVKKRRLLRGRTEKILAERNVLEVAAKSVLCVQAHAIFHTKDYIFFIMDYLAGGDLRDYMTANAPLSIPVTRFFAAEIICGLQFLHSRGIIHRDIKPDNILLDSIGHLKIADFGLAVMNVFGDNMTSGYAGTLRYVAPEMLLEKPYNMAVDWFSAGVIFYQMATGQYPFYAGSDYDEFEKSLIHDVPNYPEGLDPQAKDLIEGVLSKSPESRQVSVSHIREHPFFMGINWMDIEGAKACPPMQIQAPRAMTSQKINDVLSSTEANQFPITKSDQKLFCGITFANDGWQVLKPIQEPVICHRRTFGRIVRQTFHKMWRRIRRWK